MTQLRSLRLVRVNLGKWRPLLTADDINQSMPRPSMLLKAALWTERDLDQVRNILKSPLLPVESSVVLQAKKLNWWEAAAACWSSTTLGAPCPLQLRPSRLP